MKRVVKLILFSSIATQASAEVQLCSDLSPSIDIEGKTVSHELIRITSTEAIFGNLGPNLLFRTDLSQSEIGSDYNPIDFVGSGEVELVSSSGLKVASTPSLPYGRAFEIGSEGEDNDSTSTSRIWVVAENHSSRIFEHKVVWWPQEHQENAQVALDADSSWQIKTLWYMNGYGGESDYANSSFYLSYGPWFPNGEYFSANALIGGSVSSNSGSHAVYMSYPQPLGYLYPEHSSYMKSDRFISQSILKLSDTSGEKSGSYFKHYMRNVDAEEVGYYAASDVLLGKDDGGIDRFSFPGFVRGYQTNYNRHVFFSDIYVSIGDGAFARVELIDNADYSNASLVSPLTVTSWSPTEISAEVMLGFFEFEPASDLFIAIHNSDDELVSVVQVCDRPIMENFSIERRD